MRRVDNSSSQDGVETTSITSSVENEVRRSTAPKGKRSSIKKKMPNFNDDSDDTANEPLLQSENDINEFNQSAKFNSSKSKTDQTNERSDTTYIGTKVQKTSPTTSSSFSESITFKTVTTEHVSATTSVLAPIHNHMNTNVFGVIDATTSNSVKSTLIVEIDNTKSSAYSPSPLIFTTAKIHTDNKTKEMEPLHVTPVPILSTIEGNVIKSIPRKFDSIEKRDTARPISDSQKKCTQETEQRIINNVSSIEHPVTVSLNAKTTVGSASLAKSAPGLITKQNLLDKSLIVQTDTNIPATSSKAEKLTSTSTNILQDEKIRFTAVDKTKKNIPEKPFEEPSKFESQEQPVKINNEGYKHTSNGVTTQKHSNNNKTSILISSNSESTTLNKEKGLNSGNNIPTNKQLQRQKKTVEDISFSDTKNQTKISDSTSVPEDKTKAGIINPASPKTSLESQSVAKMLPTKSNNNMSKNSTISDKPKFVNSVPKGVSVSTTNKTTPVTSILSEKGKHGDETASLIPESIDKRNISDKSSSISPVAKGKATTSDNPISLSSVTTVKASSMDKSKTTSKTSPLTSVPSGKTNDNEKSGSASTPKIKSADRHDYVTSVPMVKTIDKPSSLPLASMSKADISKKPDSLSSVLADSANTAMKPGPQPVTTAKSNAKDKSPSIYSTSKVLANTTAKTATMPNEKLKTVGKVSSVKSVPSEQTNTGTSSIKTSTSVTKSSRKDPVATTSGSNVSKSANTAKLSGNESVAEVKKVADKSKTKISPTLKSGTPVDSKSNKGIPTSTTAVVSSSVVTTTGNKNLGTETHATSSNSAAPSVKESIVSSLPSSSTSAKTLIEKNKNIEPMFSENNKDSRA